MLVRSELNMKILFLQSNFSSKNNVEESLFVKFVSRKTGKLWSICSYRFQREVRFILQIKVQTNYTGEGYRITGQRE
jgi:hypothetical protein